MKTSSFNTVGLIGRKQLAQVSETVSQVYQFLNQQGFQVVVAEGTNHCISQSPNLIVSAEDLGKYCDLIIVVGGDGSLLHAARSAILHNKPILGINQGHLGFLADIAPQAFSATLSEILTGQFVVEQRLVLEVEIFSKQQLFYKALAINDAVIKQGNNPSMLNFDIHIDKHCIASERADGIIVSSPTGSTAYALSAGGPILHPRLQAYSLLTMFSHTLSNRPVVVPQESITEISLSPKNLEDASFRCDGLEIIHIPAGSNITIQSYPDKLQLIHPFRYNYFDNLRDKLGWGKQSNHNR